MCSENVGGSVALGTWYGGVVMGVLLSFDEAAILYRDVKVRRHKSIILQYLQLIIVCAANVMWRQLFSCNMESAPTSPCWCVFSTD